MAGLTKITDNAVEFLADHASVLTDLEISGCGRISLEAIHLLLRRFKHLESLGASVPAMARPGTKRFSEPTPTCVIGAVQCNNMVDSWHASHPQDFPFNQSNGIFNYWPDDYSPTDFPIATQRMRKTPTPKLVTSIGTSSGRF